MQRLKALRTLFEEVHQRFERSAEQLQQGFSPSRELIDKIQELQEQFARTREELIQDALKIGVAVPAQLEQLDAIEELYEAICKARRDKLRVKVEHTLDRILSLAHQEEKVFLALNKLRDEAQSLLREDANIEQLERIAQGNHPFISLLRMLDEGEALPTQENLSLTTSIQDAFGRRIAEAIRDKRIHISVQESPSYDSMELPTYPKPSSNTEQAVISFEDHNARTLRFPPQTLPEELTQEDPVIQLEQSPKTTDTLEELDAAKDESQESKTTTAQNEASPGLLALAQASRPSSSAELPPPPSIALSNHSPTPLEPATDEVPIVQPEELEHPGNGPSLSADILDDASEPTSSGAYTTSAPDVDNDLPSMPSIGEMTIAAMSEVLIPSEPISRSTRNGSNSFPKPPSTPRMPAPTFMTPLPLSATAVPDGVQEYHPHTPSPVPRTPPHIVSNIAPPIVTAVRSNMTSTVSSSASLALDSFDAMMVRSFDPNDRSRCSPLTKWQEHELNKQEHGVAVLFGSSALGLEDLSGFIEQAVGSEHLYVIDQIYAPNRFLSHIQHIAKRRDDDNMTFVLVTQHTPWDSSWVRGALDLVEQMRSSNRPLRIAFVADPPSTWSMIPSIQPLQQNGAHMFSLQTWHDSALQTWLEQLDFPTDHKIRRSIRRVTGNWSFALKFFYRQMKQNPTQWARHLGSLKQVLDSKELAQKALRIMGLTHKTTLSILHRLALEEPITQRGMELSFSHAPPRLITRTLLWAERLSLAHYEDEHWHTNPLVARLLKALR